MTVLPVAKLVAQLIEDARVGTEHVPLATCLAIAAHFKPTAILWQDHESWITLTFADGTTTTFAIEDNDAPPPQ